MSSSKTLVNNEKVNGSSKTQCSSLVLTNQVTQTEGPEVIDIQKPCCSKSLAFQNILEVEDESSRSNSNSSTIISSDESFDSISPIVQAYSDTVVMLNNMEFERHNQQEDPEPLTNQDFRNSNDKESTKIQSNSDLQQIVSRKPSQVILKDKNRLDDGDDGSKMLKSYLNESPDENVNFQEEGEVDLDENNNPVQWIKNSEKKYLEHASYLFHRERRHHLAQTINLLPRNRQFVVFNVFGDFARLLGWRRKRRKHVAFPEEVLEQYQQKGDVAGKDRFVPVAKQGYRGIAPTKKRRLSAVYTSFSVRSAEFLPRVERIEKKPKPDLTNVMEGYLCDLNGASLFLHGHATRTFESAMSTLEFTKLHSHSGAVSSASAQIYTNYSKYQMGVLSASVWIFSYSLRQIIEMSNQNSEAFNKTTIPSEIAFRKLLEQFAAMCLAVEEGVKVVLQHSYNFYNFCKECVRILKVLQIYVKFRCEIKIRMPLKRGDGLEIDDLLSKKDIVKQKAAEVMVSREVQGDEDQELPKEAEWKKFEELTGPEKFHSLKNLLNVTLDGMNLVQTQLRFLTDDIVDSVKDIAEADLLFILADMYDRIKFLENVGNKNSTKAEMNQISRLMTEFCKDFQTFVDFGQHIIKRYLEFRDMMHLSYTFLTRGLKLEMLTEMVPGNTFKKKRRLKGCCGCGRKNRKRLATNYQPKYDPNDFFRVSYRDAITAHAVVFANNFSIKLMAGHDPIEYIVPRKLQCSWGEMDGPSPRVSLDEYVELQETDDEHPPEPPKPILVSSQGSPTMSPVLSPRGSLTEDLKESGSLQQIPELQPTSQISPPTKSPKASIEKK
ncbi:unnamed protein product [Orchesella dallaii]|uniref:Uncharacterized protein n=1 Tax=Orchesella dallaii TaxID=48710 RepID=A0ABP1PPC1_9HEXA